MNATTTLGQSLRRLDDRRRQIEALVLADMEFGLLADPAPKGELETTWGNAAEADAEATLTGLGASFVVVTWRV